MHAPHDIVSYAVGIFRLSCIVFATRDLQILSSNCRENYILTSHLIFFPDVSILMSRRFFVQICVAN